MDFTFVCPTEIAEFGRREQDFRDRDAQVLGREHRHPLRPPGLAQRNHPDLKDLPFPMLADTKRELSAALGVLHKEDGVALRATFIVDPQGIIRHVERQRPLGRPQRGRGPARARRAADRRALPLQLEAGRADPGGGVTWRPSTPSARRIPEAAKDIRLNLQSVLQGGALSPAQRWGVAVASALAARNPALREAVLADAPAQAWTRRWSRTPGRRRR